MARHAVLTAVALATLAPARAAYAEDKGTIRLVLDNAVDRTRRRIALGPMIGVAAAYTIDSEDTGVPFSFGLGLDFFKIPIMPGPEEIQAIVLDAVKVRVAAHVQDVVAQGLPAPTPDELQSLTEEIRDRLVAEYLRKRRHRTLEKPQLTIALEEVRMPGGGTWITRLTPGFGVSRFTIGPTFMGSLGDVKGVYLGGEVAVHLTPRDSPRSPVIDLYVRADFGVSGDAKSADLVWVGTRLLIDLI